MGDRILIGTAEGLHEPGGETRFGGLTIDAITRDGGTWWAAVDGREIWRDDGAGWEQATEVPATDGLLVRCLLAHRSGLLAGTSEARLLRLSGAALEPVAGFEAAPGRDEWYTPWGGPPDTRSLAAAADGTLYANVHVGGVLRSSDGGESWEPTLDIHADVHQAHVYPDDPGALLAASAWGLGESRDGGRSWEYASAGLHGNYCRGVAVVGDDLLLSASTGPFADRGAVYRRSLAGGVFERVGAGVPEWFEANVDTGCLVADGALAAIGAPGGSVFVSKDGAASWEEAESGLPAIRCLALRA